jgi:hypothetical protein
MPPEMGPFLAAGARPAARPHGAHALVCLKLWAGTFEGI